MAGYMEGIQAIGALAPLLGGKGGGGTNVSQSSTNSTTVSLSTILSNMSPNAGTGTDTSGSASGSAQAAGGNQPPLLTSPYATPLEGFGSYGADDSFKVEEGTQAAPKALIYAGGAILAGVAVLALMKNGKRKR